MAKSDEPTAEQRVEMINQMANGFGQTLLTLTKGDWDMALSVATTLFASTCAQAALEHDEPVEQLFDECGPPARVATLAFYDEFLRGEDDEG